MDTPLPKLRAIEAFPVDVDTQPLVCLRDPQRYAADPLFVPLPAFFVVSLLDGRRSLVDVQPLTTLLELLRGVPGRLLHYDQSRDDTTRSAVTFASLAFPAR